MGCGEAEAPCEQIALTATRYESAAACTAATSDVLARHTDISYPVVVAQCSAAKTSVSENILPSDIKLPEAQQAPRFQRASDNRGLRRS